MNDSVYDSEHGSVVALCICPGPREAMRSIRETEAIAGKGLQGHYYRRGKRKKGTPRRGQVTLVNNRFFMCNVSFEDTGRHIGISGTNLMRLIGETFTVGRAVLEGIEYCHFCPGQTQNVTDYLWGCGGIIAEVLESGIITQSSRIIPSKGY